MNELMEIENTGIVFMDKELQKATASIMSMAKTVRRCAFKTAAIIALVDSKQCYKKDGFKTVHDWTKEAFGFKKSSSYTMLKIGKEYVSPVLSDGGKVIDYQSTLPHDDKDFNVTQIEKMLPLGVEGATEAVKDGSITPDMSCKEIGKVVKSKKDNGTPENKEAEPEKVKDLVQDATISIDEESIEVEDYEENAIERANFELSTSLSTMASVHPNFNMVELWDKDGKKYLIPDYLLKGFEVVEPA